MHDAEETGINSALFDALKMFRDNKVFTHFGLSWDKMKKLTHEEFTMIMELSAQATKAETQRLSKVASALEGIDKNK